MILYDAAWAPSPRRVRIMLAELGVAVERVTIDLRANEQLGDAYLAINPRGTVPALVLDDGIVIAESVAICRYFQALHPEPALFGRDSPGIAQVEEWTRRIEADGYAAAVYALRNRAPAFAGRGLPGKWEEVPQLPALAERAAVMWRGFAAALDRRLADRTWIATDGYSFADVTALVTIDFAKTARLPLDPAHTNIVRWHAMASARPSASA